MGVYGIFLKPAGTSFSDHERGGVGVSSDFTVSKKPIHGHHQQSILSSQILYNALTTHMKQVLSILMAYFEVWEHTCAPLKTQPLPIQN